MSSRDILFAASFKKVTLILQSHIFFLMSSTVSRFRTKEAPTSEMLSSYTQKVDVTLPVCVFLFQFCK